MATVLGGSAAGLAVACWNASRIQRGALTLALYACLGVIGTITTIFLLTRMTLVYGVASSLALSFGLAAIPFNRDSLAINQWQWGHPDRRLVLNLAFPRLVSLQYAPFVTLPRSSGSGETDGSPLVIGRSVSISIIPVGIAALSAVIGVATVLMGNALAV